MVIQDSVLKILGGVEIFVYADHLGIKSGGRLLVGITNGSETFPE
jgi:predicted HTH transcriptional regulator